jgi:hypothetical protein
MRFSAFLHEPYDIIRDLSVRMCFISEISWRNSLRFIAGRTLKVYERILCTAQPLLTGIRSNCIVSALSNQLRVCDLILGIIILRGSHPHLKLQFRKIIHFF